MRSELHESIRDEGLLRIARRLFWWKPPAEALRDRVRFVAQVMTFGNWEDVQEARRKLGDPLFLDALKAGPPGVFDEPSWTYWHCVFGLRPVPPLPRRRLQ